MRRPKEFDRDEALATAVRVFSEHGYARTSTEALLKAMGLSRQSLYDTFGSKRELYLDALRRYNLESAERIIQDIESGKSPLDGLRRALLSFIDSDCLRADPACLGVGAICEFGRRDDEIVSANESTSALIAQPLLRAFERAKALGEVRHDLDPRTATELFFCLFAGLKVSARAGMSGDRLREMAALAFNAFV
jgi:AcrR family transcriptional regulator